MQDEIKKVTTRKKTVQDIVIPATKPPIREKIKKEIRDEYDEEVPTPIPIRKVAPPVSSTTKSRNQSGDAYPRRRMSRLSSTLLTFGIVFVGIAIIAIAISLFFSKAVVTITPKVTHFTVDGTFTAKKDPIIPTDLPYEIITASATNHQTIPATSGPLIQTKAKGTAYLYNSQAIAQKILAGTRLSNTKDLIYRTSATVVIPAGKTVLGKAEPGNISVAIIADNAGSDYNMKLSDLTGDLKVVAYKGGDKYNTVYGRIKTDITGGFLGNKMIVSPDSQKATVDSIENVLKLTLSTKIKSSVPDGDIYYDTGSIIDYAVSDPTSKATSTADISVTGTAYGVVFKADTLLKFIGQNDLAKFPVPTYTTQGLDKLVFTLINSKDFSPQKGTPLIFSLKGPISLVGSFSEIGLKNELKGISVSQSNAVFGHYPGIANAYAIITPFWMRTFPSSVDKITLDIKTQ